MSEIIQPKAIDMRLFVKQLGYSRSSQREFKDILKLLVSRGFVKVQQSGFVADSMHHKKLVVIVKPIELDYFKKKILRTNYQLGDYRVHRTTKARKCEACKATIKPSERYCVKIALSKHRSYKTYQRSVREMEILCLTCAINKCTEEDVWR